MREISGVESSEYESYLIEERRKYAEFDVKYSALAKEHDRLISELEEKDELLREKIIYIDSIKTSEEISLIELRKHYEEMSKIQEVLNDFFIKLNLLLGEISDPNNRESVIREDNLGYENKII